MPNQYEAITASEVADIAAKLKEAGFAIETGRKNSIGRVRLGNLVGITSNRAQEVLELLRRRVSVLPVTAAAPTLEDILRDRLRRQKKAVSIEALCDLVDAGPTRVKAALNALRGRGFNVHIQDQSISLSGDVQPGSIKKIIHTLSDFNSHWRKFGACGDKHLCNRHARLDVLDALYDLYAEAGITEVYDTGNWIDGECRFNKQELVVFGMDAQIDYWIEKHPERKGITTYFVAGDDHEGWYQQHECIEIGRYAQMRAEKAGRFDLKYIGYVEADIELQAEHGMARLRVMHPGGGTAYALSYTGQKMVESFQGGEKPAILLQGHYHKMNLGFPREVFVVDTGTCCDQTAFMRKKKLQAMVGGWIIEINQDPKGAINRFRGEFTHFFDRGYYARRFGVQSRAKGRSR